jgi:hypothetical protein
MVRRLGGSGYAKPLLPLYAPCGRFGPAGAYCAEIGSALITHLLVRLADGPVGVEQAFAQFVERSAAAKDQIVAEFDLGEEQAGLGNSPALTRLSQLEA